MESVNQTITDALHFISFVEDVFCKKRMFVETLSLQEYNHYVIEKNIGLKKVVKPLPKERESVQLIKKQVEDKQISIKVEELALADTLLEKARNLRMKNMETLKGTKDCSNKSQTFADSSASKSSKLELQQKLCLHKNIKESSVDKRVIPRSKSSLISSTVKTTVVPRSKSANVYQVSKNMDKVPKTNEIITKMCNPKNKCSNKLKEQKTLDKINLAVLSNKELKDFKKLFSDRNDCKQTNEKLSIENSNSPFSSDCHQFSNHQCCFPTYRKLQKELKQSYVSKSCFKLHPGVIWYPYLNAKNKNYLCGVKQFESFDNLKKSMEILHKIQETMVWIDILNFVGKALFKLQLLDENDECVIRVCSYLSSICRKDLQKAPILDLC